MKLTEEKLEAWGRAVAQDVAQVRLSPAARANVLGAMQGGTVMKKTITLSAVFVAVLMIATLSAALALHGGEVSQTLDQEIIYLEKDSYVVPAQGNYPACVVVIEETYYDGENLSFSYRIEGERNERVILDEWKTIQHNDDDGEKALTLFPDLAEEYKWQGTAYYRDLDPDVRQAIDQPEGDSVANFSFHYTDDLGVTHCFYEGVADALQDRNEVTVYIPVLLVSQEAARLNTHYYCGPVQTDGTEVPSIALTIPRTENVTWNGVYVKGLHGAVGKADGRTVILPEDGAYKQHAFTLLDAAYDGKNITLSYRLEGEMTTLLNVPVGGGSMSKAKAGEAFGGVDWTEPENLLDAEQGITRAANKYWGILRWLETEEGERVQGPWFERSRFLNNEDGTCTIKIELGVASALELVDQPYVAQYLNWIGQDRISLALIASPTTDAVRVDKQGDLWWSHYFVDDLYVEGCAPRILISIPRTEAE